MTTAGTREEIKELKKMRSLISDQICKKKRAGEDVYIDIVYIREVADRIKIGEV